MQTTPSGKVQIANDVLAKIASMATMESDGVYSMAAMTTGLVRKGARPSFKGVRVSVSREEVSLELNIVVRMGKKIVEVCEDVQSRAKVAVETMTGLRVSSVNVVVSGVAVDKRKENTE